MEGWIYVANTTELPKVVRSIPGETWVNRVQTGSYTVTFPAEFKDLACTAALASGNGFITAIPGDFAGLAHNQVRVLTYNMGGQLTDNLDFTVAVACCS